ncbi:MAG: FtsX-like permease family protein [Candidatus Delongbacteria bacterium]|nr:FtsX-like permease family protein [Candidatus Delongbacteria bacterium]MCG2761141.1 FtsX-like permease family protein [Candidatus Delongbacteria bacterium]
MSSLELFIAKRYLQSKRKTAFISTITYVSFLGITLGVAVLVIVMSVMNGFETEVRTRFISNDSHIRIRSFNDRPFSYDENLQSLLLADSLITGHSPFIESYGMIKGDYTEGALVRGIDQTTISSISLLKDQMIAGKSDLHNSKTGLPCIILGKGMADKTASIIGSELFIISPAISSTFSQPPVMKFEVTGIFETGLAEVDGSLAYITLESAQKLFKMPDKINGVYIKLSSLKHTDNVKEILNQELEYPKNAVSWKDMHRNLYAWMEIEKMMMGTILSLIIIIAAFNILSSLIMIVMEKKQEIGILMAMGATKNIIMRIFMLQGMIIGIIGTILGLLIGIAVCYIQLKYQIVSLPGDIYFINAMPIQMKYEDIIIIGIVSLILTFLSTIYPSRQASKMTPAQIIRDE